MSFPSLNLKSQAVLLKPVCACVLAGILVAGLWPFHAPRNEVRWLSKENGLFFGKHGSIVSEGSFAVAEKRPDSCSLEIWLEPIRIDYAGTILALYEPASQVTPFALRQSLYDLKLETRGREKSAKKSKLYVAVFRSLRSVFITISSGEDGTFIYVDGVLVRKSLKVRLSTRDLSGRLVIGNSPSTADSWSGTVKSLAIYDRELSSAEVTQHFRALTESGLTPDSEGMVASYHFDEGKGTVVHNGVPSEPNLVVPERFFILNERFLERPWDEFYPGWNYWEDVAINIGGFVPLGFFFGAYFAMPRKVNRAIWITIALGFLTSLTIEVLQAFLPTRNSGMTDLFTNTLGTALGAMLYAWSLKHPWIVQEEAPLVRES